MKLAVIGCGKMGLPIAIQAAKMGWSVIGVDINHRVVDMINKGLSSINEPGIKDLLKTVVKNKKLIATTKIEDAISSVNVVIVIVPVLITNNYKADLRIIKMVSEQIGKNLKKGTIVSFETTLPVGTTRNILCPLLEKNGKKAGKDFYLVFSPERVKSLNIMKKLQEIPKVVGGYDKKSVNEGIKFYRSIIKAEIINAGTLEAAEMVKLAGMVYRDINIAIVNEMAMYCDSIGVNIENIIRMANTNGEAHLLQPGIGVGGHCTPIYPYFLINDAEKKGLSQTLAKQARKINDNQSEYMVQKLKRYIKNNSNFNVLILGLGFRPDVKEDIKSPAFLVDAALKSLGVNRFLYDPLYSKEEIEKLGFNYLNLKTKYKIDAIILVTAHTIFADLDWDTLKKNGLKIFIDGRNYFNRNMIEEKDIMYIGIGCN
jgi:nucleotide sugar dehydrogenase